MNCHHANRRWPAVVPCPESKKRNKKKMQPTLITNRQSRKKTFFQPVSWSSLTFWIPPGSVLRCPVSGCRCVLKKHKFWNSVLHSTAPFRSTVANSRWCCSRFGCVRGRFRFLFVVLFLPTNSGSLRFSAWVDFPRSFLKTIYSKNWVSLTDSIVSLCHHLGFFHPAATGGFRVIELWSVLFLFVCC